jgi:hypothetical protein
MPPRSTFRALSFGSDFTGHCRVQVAGRRVGKSIRVTLAVMNAAGDQIFVAIGRP